MPELPEIETIKRGLKDIVVGKRIKDIDVLRAKNFKGEPQKAVGRKITGIKRQAKMLIFELDKGDWYLLVHLKMTGQVVYRQQLDREKPYDYKPEGNIYDVAVLPNKYTRAIVHFSDNGFLLFNNLRAFGWMKVVSKNELPVELKNFSGVEPLTDEFTVDYLKKIASKTSRAIKLLLMDQKKIAGIGNIYANEALFCAGIDPRQPAKKVLKEEPEKLEKLKNCIQRILKKAIREKGTTDDDEAFRTAEGKKGGMQNYLQVYGKKDEKCPQCGGKIKKTKIGGRGTYFCPRCQGVM